MVVPEVAFKLPKGQITDRSMKSSFGWHVIRVDDKRSSSLPSFEDAREELLSEVSPEIIQGILKTLREGAKIERFNLDGSPQKK